ncbi:MAG: preprotein translocase subunit YajC [Phycisphaerae bacterium]|jgi:preprotein translocase subunit YajC
MHLLAEGGGSSAPFMLALVLAMVVYFFIISRSATKDKKRYQEMLANIKKNDRVMTIGGIIGSVVSTTNDEVVLKVDESANVKITFVRSAIKKVLTEEPKADDLK